MLRPRSVIVPCRFCGEPIQSDSRTCSDCGKAAPVVPVLTSCPRCGLTVKPSDLSCKSCKFPLKTITL